MPISHAHLRSFHAVATQGSFTRAAEVLHVTQPTLSGQVKELEERYGTKLFTRHGRHIELTELGRSALQITKKLFHYENQVEQLLQSAKGLTTGQLKVGADSPYIITPLLALFQRRYPGIQISIRYGNSEQVNNWLLSGHCDIGVLPDVTEDDDRLHTIPLESDQLVVFVSSSHPWSSRRSVTLDELADQNVILREKGSRTRENFEKALEERDIRLQSKMEISSREGVREAVAAGFGVGVVSENELGSDLRFHALNISNCDLGHWEFVICRNQDRGVRVTAAFLDLLENRD